MEPRVMPKSRDKRRSVSAVTARLPSTISLILWGGTLNARASAVWLRSSGRKNSSRRISPGVGLGSQSGSVIIVDFDIGWASVGQRRSRGPRNCPQHEQRVVRAGNDSEGLTRVVAELDERGRLVEPFHNRADLPSHESLFGQIAQ